MRRVDSHVHLYRTREEGQREKDGYVVWEYGAKSDVQMSDCVGTIEEFSRQMRESELSHAVLVNLFSANVTREAAIARLPPDLSEPHRKQRIADIDAWVVDEMKGFNGWACQLAKTYSGIVPFIATDIFALPGEESARYVRDMTENHGAAGVKLHGAFQGFSMANELLWPTYAMCQELDIPIIGHAGPDKGKSGFAEPKAFGQMLQAFPKLRCVIAHLGGGAWNQALDVAQMYPNAYFDCCEIMEWTDSPNGPSARELGKLIKEIGSNRVMMGSDFPWYDVDQSIDRVMSLPILSEEEKLGMIGENAINILKLS